jgi:hypothetical protein
MVFIRSRNFVSVCSAIVFKAFQRGPTKENIISCRSNKIADIVKSANSGL